MFARVCLLAFASGTLCGCGSGTTVEGTVTLGGALVERGAIELIPEAETVGTAARALIEGGRFRFEAGTLRPGVYSARISSPKPTGKKIKVEDGAPGAVDGFVDETIETVPAEFNQRSTLRREVTAGRNQWTFEL